MKKVKLKLELQYNSPVILTFFLLSLLVLFLDQWTDGWTTMHLFCVYRSSLKDPLFYIRLFGHVLGHASWDHFLITCCCCSLLARQWKKSTAASRFCAAWCSPLWSPACCNACCSHVRGCWARPASCSCLSCFRRWRASPAASGHHAAGCSAVLWSAGVRYHFCARQCSKLHAHCGRLMRHCLWLLQCAAQPPQAGKSGEVFQHEQPPEALNPLWT